MALVDIDNVSFSYGRTDDLLVQSVPALHNIDLHIDAGDVVLLCGPSGGGKSSVLRLMNGLIPNFHEGALTGDIRVNNKSIIGMDLANIGRLSATVFQNPRTQFFTEGVSFELAFALENNALDPDVIRRRVVQAADTLGIVDLLPKRLSTLSGGQLQRVACAACLVRDVPLVLFDEPTANLDPNGIDDFRKVITQLRAMGTTMVIAEHRLHYLRDVVTKVAVINDGRIVRIMPAKDFWALDDNERTTLGLRTFSRPTIHASVEAPMTAPVLSQGLSLRNLSFSYGDAPLINIDHLDFPAGHVHAIIGPNGVGKTTLLRLLCGLEKPDSGTIFFNGAAASARRLNRHAFLVAQDVNRQLFSPSVAGEVTLGLPADKRPDKETIIDYLQQYDLDQVRTRHPLSLSGGQKQRTVIVAAQIAGADIYLLDEPSSGVDRRHLETIATTMRTLANQGAVVIVVTHDAELINRCADRVIDLQADT